MKAVIGVSWRFNEVETCVACSPLVLPPRLRSAQSQHFEPLVTLALIAIAS